MRGYIAETGEHPETIGLPVAGLTDRHGGVDARPRRRQRPKIPGPSSREKAMGGLTRDNVLDNITLYRLTGTATSVRAAVLGGRTSGGTVAFKHPPPHVKLPVGYTVFPDELSSRRGTGRSTLTTTSSTSTRPTRAGTSAAWEEPESFAGDARSVPDTALDQTRVVGRSSRRPPVPLQNSAYGRRPVVWQVEVSCRKIAACACLSAVSDHGPGIRLEDTGNPCHRPTDAPGCLRQRVDCYGVR